MVLLFAAAAFAIVYGPFGASTPVASLIMGMTLVAAMAVQNALHRVHLSKSPPSTLMTGTTTQIMLDLAELVAGERGESSALALARVKKMILAVLAFAVGCALAAFAVVVSPIWCFLLPAVVSLFSFVAKTENPEGD